MIIGKRWFGGFLAGILVLSGSLVSAAGASQLDCVHKGEKNRTFQLTVRALENVYKIGENAEFRVRVARVIDGQELGPVEGADVSIEISLGDVSLFGGSITDEEGRALVKVRLKKYASAGSADVYAQARKQTADIPCHSELEYEFGDIELKGLFRVVR